MENYAHSALLTKSDFSSKCTLQQILPTKPSPKHTLQCARAGKAIASRGVVATFKGAAVTWLNILLCLRHWKQLTKYFCYAKCLVTGPKMRDRNTASVHVQLSRESFIFVCICDIYTHTHFHSFLLSLKKSSLRTELLIMMILSWHARYLVLVFKALFPKAKLLGKSEFFSLGWLVALFCLLKKFIFNSQTWRRFCQVCCFKGMLESKTPTAYFFLREHIILAVIRNKHNYNLCE